MAEKEQDDLQLMTAKLDKEHKAISAKMEPLRAEYDKLAAEIAPKQAKMRDLEAKMDELKPRHSVLSRQLEHLKKAV